MEFNSDLRKMEISSQLPIYQSQGFYSDILRLSSGQIIPRFTFGGWEIIDQDPFWIEKITEEQIEKNGEDFKLRNKAKEIVD